jgi:hypothetical protein
MRTEKEIKKLIAEFKPPIKKAKSVINDMRVKLHKYNGKDREAASERLEVLDTLVLHCVAMQVEMNDMEEEYHRVLLDSANLRVQYVAAKWLIKTSEY